MSQQKAKISIIGFFVPFCFYRGGDCAELGTSNLWQISFRHCWPMFIVPPFQLPAVHPGQAHKSYSETRKILFNLNDLEEDRIFMGFLINFLMAC